MDFLHVWDTLCTGINNVWNFLVGIITAIIIITCILLIIDIIVNLVNMYDSYGERQKGWIPLYMLNSSNTFCVLKINNEYKIISKNSEEVKIENSEIVGDNLTFLGAIQLKNSLKKGEKNNG